MIIKPCLLIPWVLTSALCLTLLSGCATESSRAVQPQAVRAAATAYTGPVVPVALGKFENRSSYGRGIFSGDTDLLGTQGRGIVETHLQQTGRFRVLDRTNMQETATEAKLAGVEQRLEGARFTITGEVAEFGRRETGDKQLFGIAGSGKQQLAYAKVNLRVVDIRSGTIVASTQGAGEFALSSREVLGFGGTSGYDSTLSGKVLDLAVREAVDGLVASLASSQWGAK